MSIDELDLDDEMGVEADEMVMPFNAVTLKEYKGGNIVRLLMAQRENGWSQRGWAGYHQWISVGRHVCTGQHCTYIRAVGGVREDDDGNRRQFSGGGRVFHFDQTAPLETPA
jgi:antirestriction protein ArdC